MTEPSTTWLVALVANMHRFDDRTRADATRALETRDLREARRLVKSVALRGRRQTPAVPAELKDGTLVFPDDAPEMDGYERIDPHRLCLAVVPEACADREIVVCPRGGCSRWWCLRDGRIPINPGVCARCQGLVSLNPNRA